MVVQGETAAWLRCPTCGGGMSAAADAIVCRDCGQQAPIVNGIPRFVDVPDDPIARHTQESFGYEWTHFNDWRQSGETNFNDYFQGVNLASLREYLVLDAGCGMGRHARHVAAFARHIVAIDFSRAIDQAERNTVAAGNVTCIQADLLALPLADGAFDFAYSLGVLHHIDQTDQVLSALVRKLRPGGKLRVYLYWKRHGWKGRLLRIVAGARTLTTRMPFPLLRMVCGLLSIGLFLGVVMPYRALSAAGIRLDDWPLFVYCKYPFNVLYNDQFDRFSAPIEKRYDFDEARDLLVRAGLTDVTVRPCFGWLADGTKAT